MEAVAKECFDAIISQSKRPLFVGVGGDSGSGKSYLTSLIAEHFEQKNLSYSIINHDEFLISRKDREPMKYQMYESGKFTGKSHWEILENMFRLDEYERVIKTLKASQKASFRPYSRNTGEVSHEERTVGASDFYLFDTSMLLEEMDFVIVVDVSQENIIKRKLLRDGDIRTPEQIIEMHRSVQGYYWLDRGIPAHANITIDNNDTDNVKIVR